MCYKLCASREPRCFRVNFTRCKSLEFPVSIAITAMQQNVKIKCKSKLKKPGTFEKNISAGKLLRV
jgi:hypothetical protein